MENKNKMLLVIIRIGNDETPAKQRIKEVIPNVMKDISRIQLGDGQLVFTDSDGVTMGYLLITEKPLYVVRGVITGSQGWHNAHDSCLILEVTKDFEGMGFSRAWTWMQHRAKYID